jgi:hypothetical protein
MKMKMKMKKKKKKEMKHAMGCNVMDHLAYINR